MENSTEFQVLVETTDKGLRDLARNYEKPDDIFRIVVLGDSYMEAAHVEDAAMFCRVLEQSFPGQHVETVNLGVGGYATVAQWRYLLEEGFKYDPDLVLLAFYAENDVYGNSPELSKIFWKEDNVRYFGQPYAAWNEEAQTLEFIPPDYARSMAEFDERIAKYSITLDRLDGLTKSVVSHLWKRLVDSIRTRVRAPGYDLTIHFGCYLENFDHVAQSPDEGLSQAEYEALWNEAWALTYRTLEAIAQACEEREVPFAFFNAPSQIQFQVRYLEAVKDRYPDFDLNVDLPEERLGSFAQENDIPFLNLLPAFREVEAESGGLNYRRDSHWTAKGHRLAAETVAQQLIAEGMLTKPAD
jgi:hypothetical protein